MASTSTSSIHKRFKYDVFLSFRGIDTRTNFVDHLYHALQQKGIQTYKDDERITKGKQICDELIGSIEDSKFYIIVFSKNYASSSWCLDELVKIMECHKTTDHTAYPVFYDVEPTEVRNQSGAVKEAFAKHENEEDAGKWRKALKEAADLAGWELKKTADGHEAKFIQKVIEEISLELRGISFTIDEKLVGMETRINDILSSLGTDYDDARMIGIRGMGGAGKTTLARAIFDQISFQFEGKSFVENVREVSKAPLPGLKSLQHQILSDVFKDKSMTVSGVHEGIDEMKRKMPCKKVILVLDDVDHWNQLEALAGDKTWFKPGSIIIITTRDEQVLVAHGVKSIHDVQLLSDEDAMCLFRRYAFGKVIPNPGYEELSEQFVKYAAGLPLAIVVLGSFLCGKDELEWKDALSRLKTIPTHEILEILEISYRGLEEEYKEIFLNIACFWKGWQKDYAIEALESCGFYARNGLRVLEQKSLITVDEDGELGMHDHIKEMGMNIVRRSHPDNPNKHSRLWIHEEIREILANDLGTEATRYIQFTIWNLSPEIVMQGLRKMKELRFLRLFGRYARKSLFGRFYDASEILFGRSYNELPNALQYLYWQEYPFRSLPTAFQADNLVALEMPHSGIVQLWKGGERKVLNKLRFLDLSSSKLRTLDLGVAPNLETLDLGECWDLIELRLPERCLNLRSLKLNGSKWRTLDLRSAPNLETLDLGECVKLIELRLPERCLNLRSLKLSHSKLRTLDLRSAPNLETLDLGECVKLIELRLPERCLNLRSLKLCHSKLRTLDLRLSPDLEKLILGNCVDLIELRLPERCLKIRSLKVNGSKLSCLDLRLCPDLEKLNLGNCVDLIELLLPDRCLNLRSLKLNDSKLRTLDIGLSPNLEHLNLRNCLYLEEFHMADGCLKKLVYLNLSGTLRFESFEFQIQNGASCRLDESLEGGPLAELHLIAESVDECYFHPDSNLPKFRFECDYKEDRPLLSRNLEKLISVGLCACTNLDTFSRSICGLQHLKKLVYLNLSGTFRFESFEFQIEDESSWSADESSWSEYDASRSEDESLEVGPLAELHLIAKSVDECRFHPDSNLPKFRFKCDYKDRPLLTRNLEKLISVGLCACTNLDTFSRSICGLQHLRKLTLEGSSILEAPKDLDQLEFLQHLDFSDTKIVHLPDTICVLKHLKSIRLSKCTLLEKLPEDLGQLECLEKLVLSHTKIEVLPGSICKLKHLKFLSLDGCSLLQKLPEDLGQLQCLKKLTLSNFSIKDLPDGICKLKHLESLSLDGCSLLQKLPEDLGQLQCLKKLTLSNFSIKDLPDGICKLKHLESLSLDGCSLLQKLPEDLGQLESLKILNLSDTSVKELPDGICMLKHLESLNLYHCSLLQKLPENLGQLECLNLKELDLSKTAVKELPNGICMLKHLESLNLYHCSLLQKLPENLGQLQCLERLCLSAAKIKYLPDSICLLQHLKDLHVNDCLLLEKLPEDLGRGRLECLSILNLRGCELLGEVPDSISKMKALRYLDLQGCIRVEKLPEEIGRLECLKSLDLVNTGISHLPQSILLLKGLRIYGSRRLLQSCCFTSEIRFSTLDICCVEV